MLPMIVAARNDRARLHPNDLSTKPEAGDFERSLHFGAVQSRMPHMGNVGARQRSRRHLVRRRGEIAMPTAPAWQRKSIDALRKRGLARYSGVRGPFGSMIAVITPRGRRKVAELAAATPPIAPPDLAAAAG
jgi:hypothetical protein